ncbi:hypothetical protein AS180_17875 [Priestia veravalensis]|uniref:Uncharacterized protein n=1 Tax=Priestia veravalensis TaxID=1414648 RepID=A0A0V8JHP2_9BACI|nr:MULTISPECIES: hypothetical protein [Priestia]KSU86558.1 hypothetical protein AS180_17875 [Priestia veravalensis]SCC50664.1 hypothetical protein GA0061087_10666 [Priestia flexa]
MEWHSFIIGLVSASFAYALFSEKGDQEELVAEDDQTEDIEINDFSGRHVTLSCQTCRKLKRHKEVEPNLFQCVKCKRHVDLRSA